jgi:hypothetical protein
MLSMRFVLPGLAVLAMFTPTIGHADQYKWCAQYGTRGGGGTNCGFVTYEQCLATISGIGGTCQPNQFYTGPEVRKPARKKARDTNGY